ncbi:hypothetical protein D3C71_2165390 [compost metagenome]
MVEKNDHPKADSQRIRNLKYNRMLIPMAGYHLHDSDLNLLHVYIRMKIHDCQRRSEEQQQPH